MLILVFLTDYKDQLIGSESIYSGFQNKTKNKWSYFGSDNFYQTLQNETFTTVTKLQSFCIIITACGNLNFTGSSGVIQSPNYPQHYPNNIYCRYQIFAPATTQVSDFLRQYTVELQWLEHSRMARLPRLVRTRSWVPWNKFHSCRFGII